MGAAPHILVVFLLPWALLSLGALAVPFAPFNTRFEALCILAASALAMMFASMAPVEDPRIRTVEATEGAVAVAEAEPPDAAAPTPEEEAALAAIAPAAGAAAPALRAVSTGAGGTTWYMHPQAADAVEPRSTVRLYLGARDGRAWLRMRTEYAGARMLYLDRVTAVADGSERLLTAASFRRGGTTLSWQRAEEVPDARQIAVLEALARADRAALRFEGERRAVTVPLAAADRRILRETLDAYHTLAAAGRLAQRR